MVKGLIRFVGIWALSLFLTPYVDRFMRRLADRAPKNGLLEEILDELSGQYSTTLIRSFGETVGDLVLGSKKR
jgi:hypothetical protein